VTHQFPSSSCQPGLLGGAYELVVAGRSCGGSKEDSDQTGREPRTGSSLACIDVQASRYANNGSAVRNSGLLAEPFLIFIYNLFSYFSCRLFRFRFKIR
jgi:hypothetical protein